MPPRPPPQKTKTKKNMIMNKRHRFVSLCFGDSYGFIWSPAFDKRQSSNNVGDARAVPPLPTTNFVVTPPPQPVYRKTKPLNLWSEPLGLDDKKKLGWAYPLFGLIFSLHTRTAIYFFSLHATQTNNATIIFVQNATNRTASSILTWTPMPVRWTGPLLMCCSIPVRSWTSTPIPRRVSCWYLST